MDPQIDLAKLALDRSTTSSSRCLVGMCYITIMADKGITLGVYWGYIGIMENKMETIIMGYIGFNIGL